MTTPKDKTQEGPYTGIWEKGYFVCRDTNKRVGEQVFLMSPSDERGWIERLNAAFEAGQESKWIPVTEAEVGKRYTVIEATDHAFVANHGEDRWEWVLDGRRYTRDIAKAQRVCPLPSNTL